MNEARTNCKTNDYAEWRNITKNKRKPPNIKDKSRTENWITKPAKRKRHKAPEARERKGKEWKGKAMFGKSGNEPKRKETIGAKWERKEIKERTIGQNKMVEQKNCHENTNEYQGMSQKRNEHNWWARKGKSTKRTDAGRETTATRKHKPEESTINEQARQA